MREIDKFGLPYVACSDCKHFRKRFLRIESKCLRPTQATLANCLYKVDGLSRFAVLERADGRCGPDGVLFEPK